MYFFRISLKLDSVLSISGGGDDEYNLVKNGEGRYIIPSTGIAGAIKNYINSDCPEECVKMFGDIGHHSIVTYYDAVCENVNIETRKGICIDDRYGVAENRKLFTRYYIGQGMECELKIQCNIDDKNRENIIRTIKQIAGAIKLGRIRFGSKKTDGAGVFSVKDISYMVLDMANDKERKYYIETDILSIFKVCEDKLSCDDIKISNWRSYVLEAKIPNGLLVKSGERENGASVNMSKEIDGNAECYIPASTIKGIIRSYSEMIAKYMNISNDCLVQIFGNDNTEKTNMKASTVYVDDCILRNTVTTRYNRIKVDRWLGSTISGAKTVDEVVSTNGEDVVSLRVSIDRSRYAESDEILWKYANAFVFLALRDLGLGKVSIGSGNAVGYGRLEGVNLRINDKVCPIDYKNKKVDASSYETELVDILNSLEVSYENK
jgi:CRISPR/Cas system CSM-associated protein Csm3 (group 7 of RAMP superfamily)